MIQEIVNEITKKNTMISNEIIKGSLKTIVLKLLKEEGPLHGYAITRRVEELTSGRIKLTYGALYPVLHKLESEGVLVTTSENFNNRTRIYYTLTKKGDKVVIEKVRELTEFIESLESIINAKPGLSHA
jgi:PadR family transcriptional regulator, regulatory protein PadR